MLGRDSAASRPEPRRAGRAGSSSRDYVREGIWHIWIGYDHILFLLSLLLPAVLVLRGRRGWDADAEPARRALLDVLKVVTAFTARPLDHAVASPRSGVVAPAVALGRVGDRGCRCCSRR